jgi:hypothetical protein
VRRALVVCLLVLIAVLPAIDIVYCPDGCADAGDRARCTWQNDVSGQIDGCGLCVNGLAVSSPAPYVAPVQRIQPWPAPPATDFVGTIPRPIDQPPRHS